MLLPLVVVNDLDVSGLSSLPRETNPPLLVDSNAVLALPVSLELLKTVPGRYSKVLNGIGGINEKELDEGQSVKLSRESLGPLSFENRLGHGTLEAANHDLIVTPCVNNVKRYHG